MAQIIFSEKGFNKWSKKNNLYFKGWIEYKGEIYKDAEDFCKLFQNIEELKVIVNRSYGNFSLVLEENDYIYAIVDNISSFPLFYMQDKDELLICDNLLVIRETKELFLDCNAREEFFSAGFNTGNRTVYKNVFQLQAGQMLIYCRATRDLSVEDYYVHVHSYSSNLDSKGLCDKLDNVILNVFNRMIRSIDNKPIVLFLSGGFDSKLVLSTLARLNYKNVTCISLGGYETKDVVVGEKIAKELGFHWIRVDVTKGTWRKFKKSELYKTYFKSMSGYSAFPYLQGVLIKELIDKGEIPENCVAVTGNSGDAIEGEDVTRAFQSGKFYTSADVKEQIRYKHFCLNGYKESVKSIAKLDLHSYSKYVSKTKDKFTDKEAENIYELFNWRERQVKYVVGDVRNYEDILGIDWRLPLWDREFEEFWLDVPYELYYGRKLYYEYVQAEKLPSANELTWTDKLMKKIKARLGTLTYVFYIPKSIWNYFFSKHFYWVTYGLLSFGDLLTILKTGAGNRAPHMEGIVRTIYSFYTDFGKTGHEKSNSK